MSAASWVPAAIWGAYLAGTVVAYAVLLPVMRKSTERMGNHPAFRIAGTEAMARVAAGIVAPFWWLLVLYFAKLWVGVKLLGAPMPTSLRAWRVRPVRGDEDRDSRVYRWESPKGVLEKHG